MIWCRSWSFALQDQNDFRFSCIRDEGWRGWVTCHNGHAKHFGRTLLLFRTSVIIFYFAFGNILAVIYTARLFGEHNLAWLTHLRMASQTVEDGNSTAAPLCFNDSEGETNGQGHWQHQGHLSSGVSGECCQGIRAPCNSNLSSGKFIISEPFVLRG